MIDKSPDNKYSADFFIKGKVWIDNKLVKEAEFGIVHDSIALMKKDAIKY